MADGVEGARMEAAAEKKQAIKEAKKAALMPNVKGKVFGAENCMAPSGPAGGTPMVSRPGK